MLLPEILNSMLMEAMEANMFGYVAYCAARLPQMTVLDEDDFLIVNSGLPSDTFNYICRAKFAEKDIDSKINFAIKYFRAKNLPFA